MVSWDPAACRSPPEAKCSILSTLCSSCCKCPRTLNPSWDDFVALPCPQTSRNQRLKLSRFISSCSISHVIIFINIHHVLSNFCTTLQIRRTLQERHKRRNSTKGITPTLHLSRGFSSIKQAPYHISKWIKQIACGLRMGQERVAL